MGFNYTAGAVYDEAKQIHASKLKKWGYFDSKVAFKAGTLRWSLRGENTGSISISSNPLGVSPYIELDYKAAGKAIKYRVQLVSIPSNLGKGKIWYFVCPATLKRCRILYLVGEAFLHRDAFKGCHYESQNKSHKNRKLEKLYSMIFAVDVAYKQINEKYFKRFYKGRPTKRYRRLSKTIQSGSGIGIDEQCKLLAM